VDDNADMRDYLQRLLGELGAVETAADGSAALAAAIEQPPDLVLSDVMMPGLDGLGLLRALRADPRTRQVPVILVSAQALETARVEALQAGADDYLIKPFSSRELVARVRARLELAGMRQEAGRRERALRLEAQSALRMRDEFVSFTSHDLRSPLTTIKGMAQLLQRILPQAGNDISGRIGEGLAAIDAATVRMDALISELLDTARLQSGQPLALELETVDLGALLRKCVNDQSAMGVGPIRLDLEPGPLIARCDPARVERVATNLLANAIKYSPRPGTVTVSLRRLREHGGDWACLVVQDQGIGIPEADLPHMFERFHRARNVLGRFDGNGLGLAGAKQIVDQHGGTIGVTSEEGSGSSFTVRLPLDSVDAPPQPRTNALS
jgi:signal transduction histidine kinase